MDHVQLPNLHQALDDLPQDQTHFSLAQSLPDLEQHSEIRTIAVLHHHVDVRGSLNGLVETDRVLALDEVVEAHFLLDAVHVFLAYGDDFDYLARIGSIDLILRFLLLLCFTYFSVLTYTEHFLDIH